MSHNRDLSAAAAQIGFHSSNIGIGTDAPSETITLNHANGASIGLEYDGTENGTINVNSAAMYARAGSGKHLILGGNATESVRLTSGGDVSIGGLASPRAKLDIEDAGTSKDVILRVSADDNVPYALVVANDTFNTTSNRGLAFWVGTDKVHHIEARTSTTNSENEIMVSAGDAITFRTNVSEERLRIDSSGRLGLGVVPEAFHSNNKAVIRGDSGYTILGRGDNSLNISQNFYYDSSDAGKYIANGEASLYNQSDGSHSFYTAASGSANAGASMVERLRITNNGTVHTAMTGTAPTWLGNTMACREKFSVFQGANFGEACFNIDVDNANTFLSHNMYYDGGWKIKKSGHPVRHLEIGTNGWKFMTGADGADDTTSALTERLHIDSDGHVRFGSSGTGYDSAWSSSNYGNTEVAIDGGGGYGVLHFRGDGAGSVNTRFSMGVGDEIFYMCYDDVAGRHNIQVNSSGHVRKPQQPAFCVYRNQSGWSLAAGDTFVFNTAEFNVGGHYNTSNGRFTAPGTGTYVFHFYSIYNGDASNDYIQMYKNGARINVGDVHFTNTVGSGGWDCVHYSRVIQLSSGDYVYMRTGSGHYFHGNNWGGWSGYMLG